MIKHPIPWPDGAHCACAITFDMDADSLIHISKPADIHKRLYPTSMGKYGPTVTVLRILETYQRLGLQQSFFVPGWCVEQYPEAVEAMLRATSNLVSRATTTTAPTIFAWHWAHLASSSPQYPLHPMSG